MQWYYSKNGTQLGPVAEGELLAKLASGEVTAMDMVWNDGMKDWLAAGKVPELASFSSLGSATSPLQPMQGPVLNSPYAPPSAPAYAPPMVTGSTSKATASMVLGIVGIVFGLCGCYGVVISLPCSILAIVFGGQMKQAIASDPSLAGMLGTAKAGVIMGWVGIGISVLLTLVLVGFGVFAGMSGTHR